MTLAPFRALALLTLVPALAGSALAGCATETQALAARLESCGLLSEGALGTTTLQAVYAPDACYQQCLAEAQCGALTAALCRTSLDLLIQCDQRCAHHCGDGSLLGVERRCDGFAQCEDGSDEQGCDFALICNDGRGVPGARCDGSYNCPSGEDETGCTTEPMRCDGGRYFGNWERCDGYASCVDGADERGCPAFTCRDGRIITHRPGDEARCNGWTQCGDGSDEEGCARLTLMCTAP